MAKNKGRHTRTLLEPAAEFNFSSTSASSSLSSVRSLAVSTFNDSQTLIYIGTETGNLLLLSLIPSISPINSNSNDSSHRQSSPVVSFLRSVSISARPVDAIEVIDHIGQVLLLSDGVMFMVDYQLLQSVRKLGSFKGVNAVVRRVKSSTSSASNLVADVGVSFSSLELSSTGQRLLQKLGGGMRSNGVKTKELDLQKDGNCIFAISIAKRLILVDLVLSGRTSRNDKHVDGDIGSFLILKEIQCVDGVNTMVWIDDSIIIGNSSGYYLYSCVTGQGGLIFSLPDLSSHPKLKLLPKELRVLLVVDNVGITVNSQGVPVGGSLVFRGAPDSIGEIGSCIAALNNGKMDLFHKKTANCIQVISFSDRAIGPAFVTDIENAGRQIVVVATPNKVIFFHKVLPDEQVKDLLRKKNFEEAISLVEELQVEGEMTSGMLSFVHAQVGFLLLFDLRFEEAIDHFLLSETMQPSEIFPFIMRDPNRWSLLVPRNRYWGLHPPPVPLENVVDDGLVAIQRAIFLKKAGVESAVDDNFLLNPPSRADLLESAITSIIRYLNVSREKELTTSVKEGVDTLLMYLYRALNFVEDMEKLASSENSCIVEELEILLNESGHLRTLAFLYASKGMSSKALTIWRILARNYSSSNRNATTGDNESLLSSVRENAAIEASKILEESSDQNLVLQHLGWIADINQEHAIRVLTSDKRTIQLSPDEVIATIDPKKVEILQRYLQWLIEEKDCEDTQFHTTYALLLAKSAIERFETENLSVNEYYDGTNDSDIQAIIRERLQIFLQSSELYDPEEVLDLIESSELWLEKAILYKRLGQEAIVLEILALKLEDSEAAEQYCAEIGRSDAYMQLLDMYLDPKDGKEPMFKAAVRLLHNHGESLDPLQVLERLSADMPLNLASDTILRMLRARLHHHRQGQIVHNQSSSVHIDASLGRLEERSRHVQINDESICDSCHARLGTKLFAMYPDDTIVCYKCFRRQGETKSITGRDFKQDPIIRPGWLVTR
ncbi:vacuolar sorting protein 3 [Impatiens glandulifera]|uniref:vacuolar sorting protein 3 n=1 Tax=Impatiens glandulifera TaxID=253017 RepID=UPI001FB0F682|nr:vacuolar sorting protein 3 [Impatiens glandulifera]